MGYLTRRLIRETKQELKERYETAQSLEELPIRHSKHYPYIRNMVPMPVLLSLSRHRGDRKALTWRVKLLKLLNVVGPQTGDMLMVEYMLTAESSGKSAGKDAWRCGCGAENPNTDLFCKDCGQYR